MPETHHRKKKSTKDVMIRFRAEQELINKLDYLVEIDNSDRSKIIRKGIEIQYREKKKG